MFNYGEDSIDVAKSLPLSNPMFIARNFYATIEKLQTRSALRVLDSDAGIEMWGAFERAVASNSKELPDPVLSRLLQGRDLGGVSEKVQGIVASFIKQGMSTTCGAWENSVSATSCSLLCMSTGKTEE
jgi:hypothetical protein